ncbi:MAG: cytochrome c peroxidase [Rhizobiaceae bacterium]
MKAVAHLLALATIFLAGCSDLSDGERRAAASMALSRLAPPPPDPSNAHADDPAAAALGATLFFDQRLSRNGQVACGTCHVIDRQFQDGLPLGRGIGTTDRRTMPLAGMAWNDWFFWDGRRDSLWAQALVPLEDAREHGGTRAGYAHFMQEQFGERYARIFGPLPDLSGLPAEAGPFGSPDEIAAWNRLTPEQRDSIDSVFANIGKAIAAFERSLAHAETRFDRFADAIAAGKRPEGNAALSAEELAGLKIFLGKGQCATCHTGPRFTDGSFHNTGVPPAAGLPADSGRAGALDEVEADPFNCLGPHSDSGPQACGELRFMARGEGLVRAYKTPSLRGAAARPPYMHAGQFATLDEVLDHYARAPAAPAGVSELHAFPLSERERAQLIAFLKTLDDPTGP